MGGSYHNPLLDTKTHRFDDWVDGDHFVSRLTIAGNDGVPRTYEARAESHSAARQQTFMLAASDGRAASQLLRHSSSRHSSTRWSNVAGSSPHVANVGGGGDMPSTLQDAAAPAAILPAVMPVAMPFLTPVSMSVAFPQVPGGSYPLHYYGYPLQSSATTNALQGNQLCAQAHGPQQPPPASYASMQVDVDDTVAGGPLQPMFRIDRKPSSVESILSSQTRSKPSIEDETTPVDSGIPGSAGTFRNRHFSMFGREAPGQEDSPRGCSREGFGIESGVISFGSSQRHMSHRGNHACLPRSGILSGSVRDPLMDHHPSSLLVHNGGPSLNNCMSGFKRRKTCTEKVLPDDRLLPIHTSPETTEDATDTEEDCAADDDYLTTYNELCQRGVANLEVPEYKYVYHSSAKTSSKWECCATTTATPPGGGSHVTLSKIVSGKTKKDARRFAAKALLSELVERNIISRATVATKGIFLTSTARAHPATNRESEGKMNANHFAAAAAAVSILNQLWQKEKFIGKPKWTLTPASSGATGHWMCSIFIRTKQFGDVSAKCTQSQKKLAKHFAALNAVQKLRELGFADVDNINVQPRPQVNVVETVADECDEGRETRLQSLKALNEAAKSRLDGVLHSCGEVTGLKDGELNPDSGTIFQVPSKVKTVIARNEGDVNDWIVDNVADGAALGLCIDSRDLRKSLEAEAKECLVDVESTAFSSRECRAIALSTEKSAILVAKSLLRSCVQTEWVPSSIRFMLERSECAKYGLRLDEGSVLLRYSHGIKCANLNNLSSLSHALKEDWHPRQVVSETAAALVSDWVNQRFSPFSDVCIESVNGLEEAVKSTEDVIAPVISLAVGCRMVLTCQRLEIDRRRRKVTNRDDLTELNNRLWRPLDVTKPPFKMRPRLLI